MKEKRTVRARIERHLTGLVAAALLGDVPLWEFEDMLRRRVICAALRKHRNSIARAAVELNTSQENIRRRMMLLGIPRPPRTVQASYTRRRRAA